MHKKILGGCVLLITSFLFIILLVPKQTEAAVVGTTVTHNSGYFQDWANYTNPGTLNEASWNGIVITSPTNTFVRSGQTVNIAGYISAYGGGYYQPGMYPQYIKLCVSVNYGPCTPQEYQYAPAYGSNTQFNLNIVAPVDNPRISIQTNEFWVSPYNAAYVNGQRFRHGGQYTVVLNFPAAPLVPPEISQVTFSQATSGVTCGAPSVYVQWNPVQFGVAQLQLNAGYGYQLFRSTTAGNGYSKIADVQPNTNFYTDTNVVIGTTYYYKVLAYNAAGSTPFSPEVSGSYTPSCGTIKIPRVGSDGMPASAPAGTLGRLDNAYLSPNPAPKSENPADFANITTDGSYEAYSTDVPGYIVTVATCNYPVGGTECNIDSSLFATPPQHEGGYYGKSAVVTADQVTKVAFRYSLPSSVTITRVGSDGLTSSVPPGTQGKLDTALPAKSENPAEFTNVTEGPNHTVYATTIPGYSIAIGTCNYNTGGSECSVNNFTPCLNISLCYTPLTAVSGKVSKVVIKYTKDLFSVKVSRVGADQSLISGTEAKILSTASSASSTTSNPGIFNLSFNVNSQPYSLDVTDLPGYDEFQSGCQYQSPNTDCSTTPDYFPISQNVGSYRCDGTYCHLDKNFGGANGGWTIKRTVRYVQDIPPVVTTSAACGGKVDLTWTPMVTGSYLITPSIFSYYTIFRSTSLNGTYRNIGNTYSSGANNINATSFTDPGGLGTLAIIPGITYYYKILASTNMGYVKLSGRGADLGPGNDGVSGTIPDVLASSGVPSQTCAGSIKITRVGSDGMPSTVPAGTFGKIDTLVASSTNPSDFNNLTIGAHSAFSTDLPGYTEKIGSCTYPTTGTECNISLASTTVATCSGGFCSLPVTVVNGQTIKVAVVYDVTKPLPPGYLTVSPSSACSSNKMTVSWPASTGATGYHLYRSTTPTGTYIEITDTANGTASTTFSDTVASSSTSYYYKVSAFNSGGASAQSVSAGGTSSAVCVVPVPAPVITGPTSGFINTNYTFSAVSNYASGTMALINKKLQTAAVSNALLAVVTPQLKYGFDWDKNGTVDEWQPTTGYKDIGVPASSTRSWPTVGVKLFQVKAMDDKGSSSTWTPFAISITNPATTTATTTTITASSIRVAHFGETALVSPYPFPGNLPSGFFAQLDATNVTQRTDNPHDYASTTVGSHTLYVKDISGYTESVGTCEYPQGGTECNVSGSSFGTGSISCNGTLCTIPTTTSAGKTTKVAVLYSISTLCPLGQSGVPPLCTCDATGNPPVNGSCSTLVCNSPQVLNNAGTACICLNGGTGSNCSTLTCTLPQVPNSNGTSCVCNNGGSGPSCACTPPQVVGTGGFCQCPLGTSGTDCSQPSSPQIVTFSAVPNTVNKNNPCNLKLVAQGVGSCTITGIPIINANSNGYISDTINTDPITQTTRFTATCSNKSKTETVSRNVTCFLNPSTIEQ